MNFENSLWLTMSFVHDMMNPLHCQKRSAKISQLIQISRFTYLICNQLKVRIFSNTFYFFNLFLINLYYWQYKRSASTLHRLNNYMRASMGKSRLSSLALLHIHYDTTMDLDVLVDTHARLHPRRIQLGNLL